MISITAGDTVLKVYNSIKEIPIKRYKLMQQYLLQESGIGSTIQDLDLHLAKTVQFISSEKPAEAKEELTNLRLNFFSLLNNISFKTKACACLIADREPDDALPIIETMPEGELSEVWENVKKNLIQNLKPTSPDGLEVTLSTLTTSEDTT